MEELIKYFNSLEQRLAAAEARLAKQSQLLAHQAEVFTQLQEIIDQLQQHDAQLQQRLAELPATGSNEPEIEVELLVADDDETEQEVTEVSIPETQIPAEEEVKEEIKEEVKEEVKEEHHISSPTTPGTSATESATLAPPISNIRDAISIGDRFLFQRELFRQDGELMNKTIDHLNQLSSLSEAKAYIEKKFNWSQDNPAYELFINILKRRWQ